jgi:cytochrome c oxidase assembly factor CtaG
VHNPSGWDLAVLTLLGVLGLLYAVGSWRLARRNASLRLVERAGFWVGWAAMVAAVAPPLDSAAAQRFSMHMIQHELLMLVGAPLMIVGRPIVPWLWALPDGVRATAGAALQAGSVASVWRWFTFPLVAWALHGFTLWVWHLPALYEAAVRHEGIHAFQHATFVATAVFFWWGLVYGRYGPWPTALRSSTSSRRWYTAACSVPSSHSPRGPSTASIVTAPKPSPSTPPAISSLPACTCGFPPASC